MEKVDYKQYLGKTVQVVIDRPIDSLHPKFKFRYEINYGYILNTKAEDNEEIDVYVLDEVVPLKTAKVKIIAIIQRQDDIESKLVGITKNQNYTDAEILNKVNFVEKYFKSKLIR